MEIKMFCDLNKKILKQIANLHFEKWSQHNPNLKLDDKIEEFCNEYAQNKNKIPCGFAIFEKKELVGFCRLRIENLKKYPNIFPWISSVLILEKFRGLGYGSKLIEFAEIILKSFGYKTAYVWTDQAPDFYKKLGYIFVKMVEKNEGGLAELYKKEL